MAQSPLKLSSLYGETASQMKKLETWQQQTVENGRKTELLEKQVTTLHEGRLEERIRALEKASKESAIEMGRLVQELDTQRQYNLHLERQHKEDRKQVQQLSAKLQAIEQGRFTLTFGTTTDAPPGRSVPVEASPTHREGSHVHQQTQLHRPRRVISQEDLGPSIRSAYDRTPAESRTKKQVSFSETKLNEDDSSIDEDPPTKWRKLSSEKQRVPQTDGSSDSLVYEYGTSDSHTLSSDGGRNGEDRGVDSDLRDMTKLAQSLSGPASSPTITLARNAVEALYSNSTASANQSSILSISARQSSEIPTASGNQRASSSDDNIIVQHNDEKGVAPLSIETIARVSAAEALDANVAFDRTASGRLRTPNQMVKTRKAMANEEDLISWARKE